MTREDMYEIFEESLVGASTYTSVTCGFCDKEHFVDKSVAGDAWDNDPHYQKLDTGSKSCAVQPKRHFEPIRHGSWGGTTVVPVCDCGGMQNLASKIWASRGVISSFLNTMLERKLDEAQRDLDQNMVAQEE